MDFKKSSPDYWSPNVFNVNTLIGQCKFKINSNLSISNEAAISYAPQNPALGTMFTSVIDYKIHNNWNVKISGFFVHSPRDNEKAFWSTNATCSLITKF